MIDKTKTVENIKSLRTKLGLSQGAFGKRIGVTGSLISILEAGKIPEQKTEMYALALSAAYGINKDELIVNGRREYDAGIGCKCFAEDLIKIRSLADQYGVPMGKIVHDIIITVIYDEELLGTILNQ